MARLVVVEGPDQGKIFPLQKENLLGTCPGCNLSLKDEKIAPEHLRLFQDEGNLWALTSQNKDQVVSVNHQRCLHRHLEHSDIIQLGNTVLIFLEDEEESRCSHETGRPSAILARVKSFEDPQTVIDTLVQTDRPEKRLTTLYNISNVLSQVGEFEELCEKILKILFEEFPADRGSILIRKEDEIEVKEVSSRTRKGGSVSGVRIPKTILREVIESKDAVLTKDAISDDRFQGGQSIAELNIHSAISVPLLMEKEVRGVLYVDTVKSGEAFSEDDLKLLAAIGMQVSQVFQKIHLEKIRREKEKLERQMRDAERVQKFLIPKEIPEPVGLDIGSKYVLSQGLGGDYYDIMPLKNERLAFVVADVSGHDISSALIMCMCRSVLRQFCKELDSPAEILARTNEVLVEDMVSGMFITLFLAIFDPALFSLSFANAGHPYPIYITGEGDVKELTSGTGGAPLGITRFTTYQESSLTLSEGEGLFIFTDGLIEIKSPQGKFYGRENLIRTLSRTRDMASQDMVEYLFQSASQFCISAPLADDITLVALRVPRHLSRHQYRFSSNPKEVDSYISQITEMLKQKGFGTQKEVFLNLVLREALLNAIIHGNKEAPEKMVSVLIHTDERRAYVQIEDEGEGFDTSLMVDDFKWIPGESSHGRGLLLIRQYVDRMGFNSKGNRISLEFKKDYDCDCEQIKKTKEGDES